MADFPIKVVNVVAFTELGIGISLDTLANKTGHADYEPEQSPGIVYRFKELGASALVFSNGKIVCTGAKSVDDAKEVIEKALERLRAAGVHVPGDFSMEVESIVAISELGTRLDLQRAASALGNAEYNPEQFPGVICRAEDPRVDLAVFESGKIICTGAQNMKVVKGALARLRQELKGAGVKP